MVYNFYEKHNQYKNIFNLSIIHLYQYGQQLFIYYNLFVYSQFKEIKIFTCYI